MEELKTQAKTNCKEYSAAGAVSCYRHIDWIFENSVADLLTGRQKIGHDKV